MERKVFFTKEHIERSRFNSSPELCEQAIHCLELVSRLVEEGLDFQFKGGNSLLLILPKPKRFSIDVDIATDQSQEEIESVVEKIVNKKDVFTEWDKITHTTTSWSPLASYHLYYKSIIKPSEKTFVMLDVQLLRSPYRTEEKVIECGDLYKSSVEANVPLPSCIVGDKLITLGPNTLGIPVGKGMGTQRLKHIYDIARILEMSPRFEIIQESFQSYLQQENRIQGANFSVQDVIDDTLDFCRCVKSLGLEIKDFECDSELQREIIQGLESFVPHLFDKNYTLTNLKNDIASLEICLLNLRERLVRV